MCSDTKCRSRWTISINSEIKFEYYWKKKKKIFLKIWKKKKKKKKKLLVPDESSRQKNPVSFSKKAETLNQQKKVYPYFAWGNLSKGNVIVESIPSKLKYLYFFSKQEKVSFTKKERKKRKEKEEKENERLRVNNLRKSSNNC